MVTSETLAMETWVMDKDRIAGSVKVAVGGVKEAFGKAVGDKQIEAEGKVEKTVGKLQNAIGGVKDAARDAIKK